MAQTITQQKNCDTKLQTDEHEMTKGWTKALRQKRGNRKQKISL